MGIGRAELLEGELNVLEDEYGCLDEMDLNIVEDSAKADGVSKKIYQIIYNDTYPDGHTEILFTPLAPYETPAALDRICMEYNRVTGNMEVEPLIAIPIFIHDFLCIHPFNDGNGRMSRLLTALLLYRAGFYVGKYISLEAKIARNKGLYYDALGRSQAGWREGKEDVLPFTKYILGIILSAYKACISACITDSTQDIYNSGAVALIRALFFYFFIL